MYTYEVHGNVGICPVAPRYYCTIWLKWSSNGRKEKHNMSETKNSIAISTYCDPTFHAFTRSHATSWKTYFLTNCDRRNRGFNLRVYSRLVFPSSDCRYIDREVDLLRLTRRESSRPAYTSTSIGQEQFSSRGEASLLQTYLNFVSWEKIDKTTNDFTGLTQLTKHLAEMLLGEHFSIFSKC